MSGPAHAYLGADEINASDDATKKEMYEKAKTKANDAKCDVDGSFAHAFAWSLEAGYGCEADDAAATRWYEIAVERGSVPAITTMGCREYERKSYESARSLFERGTAKNDPDSMWHLARMCRDGQGGPADHVRAFKLCEKAAVDHDLLTAWNTLGLMHEEGVGCHKNIKAARLCWLSAARRGFQDSIFNLGRIGINKFH